MTVKAGRHKLTGIVPLGQYNNDMRKIKTGTPIAEYKTTFFAHTIATEYISLF